MRKCARMAAMLIAMIMMMCGAASAGMSPKAGPGEIDVEVSAYCVENNSLGDDWNWTVDINDVRFAGTYEQNIVLGAVKAGAGDKLVISVWIEEWDAKYSEEAKAGTEVTLSESDVRNGCSVMVPVTVVENGGRYDGNIAKWEFWCVFS